MTMLIEKLAVFGRAAQRAVSQTFRRRLVPAKTMKKNPLFELMGFAAISPKAKKELSAAAASKAGRAELEMVESNFPGSRKALERWHGRTLQPASGGVAGVFKQVFDMGASPSARGTLTKKINKLTPSDKRVLRSVVAGHELSELGQAGIRKKVSASMRHRGHRSPAVLLDESSRLSALGPEHSRVKGFMAYVRKVTGEESELQALIPGYKHGVSRFNRSQRKRWVEVLERRQVAQRIEYEGRKRARRVERIQKWQKKKRKKLKRAQRIEAVAAGGVAPARVKAKVLRKATPRAVASDMFK